MGLLSPLLEVRISKYRRLRDAPNTGGGVIDWNVGLPIRPRRLRRPLISTRILVAITGLR